MNAPFAQIGLLLFLTICSPGLSAQSESYPWLEQDPKAHVEINGETNIPVVSFEGLAPLLDQSGPEIRVINFWATWCAPCVKELPHFEALREKYAGRGVEVTLVSLDMPAFWEKRLPDFIEKRDIRTPVVVLDDPRQNDWIPKVSPDWSGAIPATLIYTEGRRAFYEKSFDGPALEAVIDSFLNP